MHFHISFLRLIFQNYKYMYLLFLGSGVNLLLITPEKAIKLVGNDFFRYHLKQEGYVFIQFFLSKTYTRSVLPEFRRPGFYAQTHL